jgi:O-antigen/teichoic acid export membrane protein
MIVGAAVYLFFQFSKLTPPLSAILFALPASVLAMVIGGYFGKAVESATIEAMEKLHRD